MAEPRSYRFEPLDQRGILLGLGASQVAVLVLAVAVALGLVTSWPGGGGFAAAASTLAVGGLLCRPVAGRAPPQWLRVAASFAGRRRVVALRPPALSPGLAMRLPAKTFAPGMYLCELPATGGHGPVGALLDERSGTAAAILRAKGSSFCLLDDIDKEHKLAAWAAVLESFSGHRSSLVRLQWCQRSLSADSTPLIAHLRQAGDPASPGYRGHASLLEGMGFSTWRHETLVVVTVRCRGRAPARTSQLGWRRRLAQRGKRAPGPDARCRPGLRRSARRAGHGRRAGELPRPEPRPRSGWLPLATGCGGALGRAPGRGLLAQDLLGGRVASQPRRARLSQPAVDRHGQTVVLGGDGPGATGTGSARHGILAYFASRRRAAASPGRVPGDGPAASQVRSPRRKGGGASRWPWCFRTGRFCDGFRRRAG